MNKFLYLAMLVFAFQYPVFAGAAEVSLVPSPAGGNSSLPRLVGDRSGGVYLSWVSHSDNSDLLMYSKLMEGEWLTPQLVASGDNWFINWADFPSLAVNDDTMAAHWLELNAKGFYSYDVKAAFYDTATSTWGEPITVNRDGLSAEHGFVSMLPLGEGRTFIAWLDGRNTVEAADNVVSEATYEGYDSAGAMSLRAGIFDRHGQPVDEWELDRRVCDCCQTSAALAASGPVLVYRDRSEEEIRDIYIIRLVDGQWSTPAAVHHDGWKIEGCPVNGPAVAARDTQVAVVWFSAKNESPEVRLSLSGDNGASFSEPLTISRSAPIGRVGATYLDSGNIALSWMDARGDSAQLMVALYDAGGHFLDRTKIADVSPAPQSGFPVIVNSGDDIVVAWTDAGAMPEIRIARIRF